MKTRYYSVFPIIIFAISCGLAQSEYNPWQRYISYPDAKASVKFYNYICNRDSKTIKKMVNSISSDELSLLERQIISCDSLSIKIAVKMLEYSDGSVAEDICISLGKLIRIQPQLLLHNINKANDDFVGAISANLGSEYVDRDEAKKYEYVKRIEALDTISQNDYNAIKMKCINSIKQELNLSKELKKTM